jgi:hypothetical protein
LEYKCRKLKRSPDMHKTILALAAIALLTSAGFVAFYYLDAHNTVAAAETTSVYSTTSSGMTSSTPGVDSAFLTHLLNLVSQNAIPVIGDYDPNATVVWKDGYLYGEYGNFTTIHHFSGLFGNVLMPQELPFLVKNLTYTSSTSGHGAFVNATFALAGPYGCKFLALVNAQETYSFMDGRWLITNEVWDIHNIVGVTCLQVST